MTSLKDVVVQLMQPGQLKDKAERAAWWALAEQLDRIEARLSAIEERSP